jgi:NAD(P)H-quinone oxidoreductase subunit L|tara:strand:+ start:863 stop:1114 length:252 start_codon:yes stop_codon:yes gene_type:complete
VILQAVTSPITIESMLVLGAYLSLGSLYLVVVPLLLYSWMNRRWHCMGKLERLGAYGMVFLFFPGLILFAPFLNMRLNGQGEV